MDEIIRLTCPECKSKLRAKEKALGKKLKCPKCGTAVLVERPPVEKPEPEADADNIFLATTATFGDDAGDTRVINPEQMEADARQVAQAEAPSKPQEPEPLPPPKKKPEPTGEPAPPPKRKAPAPQPPKEKKEEPPKETSKTKKGEPSKEEGVHFAHPLHLRHSAHYYIFNDQKILATWKNNGRGWLWQAADTELPAAKAREEMPNSGNFFFAELDFEKNDAGKETPVALTVYKLIHDYALRALGGSPEDILPKIQGHSGLVTRLKAVLLKGIRAKTLEDPLADAPKIYDFLRSSDFHTWEVREGD